MANQNRFFDADLIQHGIQRPAGLVFLIGDRARQRYLIGTTITCAAVNQSRHIQSLRSLEREVPPHRNAAQAFVQEHQNMLVPRRLAMDPGIFQPFSGDTQMIEGHGHIFAEISG